MNENEPGDKTSRYSEKTATASACCATIARFVPPDITDQVKQGFAGPDASWFRGESIDYARVNLSHDALMCEFLQLGTVRRLVEEHLDGRENRRLLLWSLLNFEHWCSTFLGAGPEASHAPDSSLLSTGARA